MTDDDARAKAIAKSLRERKAHVGDVRAGSRDPVALRGADLLVIDSRRNAATDARVAEVRSDVRARWASVATIDYTTLAGGDGTVDLRALEGIVGRLAGMDKALTERARKESSFETMLAPLGPTRTLRALALAGPTLHVTMSDGTLKATVDLADELLVSSFAERKGEKWEAWQALAHVLGLTDANVVVERRAHATAMNIMEPVDQALENAAQERAKAPELFQEEIVELSGLHLERREPAAAAAPAAQAAGQAAPRARTIVGMPPVPPPAAKATGSMRPQPPKPSAPRPSAEESFADVPTGQAAPGLLQRMARAPANDGATESARQDSKAAPVPAAPAQPSARVSDAPQPAPATPLAPQPAASSDASSAASTSPPQLTVERPEEGDDYEGEGEQYDAGEVTVVADASQLDMLRETLAGIDAQSGVKNKPLTSTMPAPPSTNSGEIETVEPVRRASEPTESESLLREFVATKPLDEVAGSDSASSTVETASLPEAVQKPELALPQPPATPAAPVATKPRDNTKTASLSPRPSKVKLWIALAIALLIVAAIATVLATKSPTSNAPDQGSPTTDPAK